MNKWYKMYYNKYKGLKPQKRWGLNAVGKVNESVILSYLDGLTKVISKHGDISYGVLGDWIEGYKSDENNLKIEQSIKEPYTVEDFKIKDGIENFEEAYVIKKVKYEKVKKDTGGEDTEEAISIQNRIISELTDEITSWITYITLYNARKIRNQIDIEYENEEYECSTCKRVKKGIQSMYSIKGLNGKVTECEDCRAMGESDEYSEDWWVMDYACANGCCICCGCTCGWMESDEMEDEEYNEIQRKYGWYWGRLDD